MSRNEERRASRLRRLESIRWQQHVDAATTALGRLRSQGAIRPAKIKVRSALVNSANFFRAPAIERIAAPRGVTLQVYLLMLFEAQCRKRSGETGPSQLPLASSGPEFLSWVDIVASEAKENLGAIKKITERGQRARQISSAFARLAKEGLVLRNRGGTADGAGAVIPLHESGASTEDKKYSYLIPEWYEKPPVVLELPITFFTMGWIYLLTPAEVRMYLCLRHLSASYPDKHRELGVYFSPRVNAGTYHLSRDVYEAHLMLRSFGLIERVSNPLRHRDGKVVGYAKLIEKGLVLPAHRFRVNPDGVLNLEAGPRMRRALMNYSPGTPGSSVNS
ncbi:hypothetical protein [Streptomyces sp. NPDC002187]|uniref:hypothetical protein n=1 Tax=Streptomyces sp. NPDC002187 TaxID=3364637 RepID=UPI003699245E